MALVFKPDNKNSFRLTYNEAIFGPSALEVYVDFPVQIQSPGVLDVWLSGQATAQNFDPNAPIEIVGGNGATLPAGLSQWPLAVPYGAVAGQVLPELYQGLGASPAFAPLLFCPKFLVLIYHLVHQVLYKVIMHLMEVHLMQLVHPLHF